MDYSFDTKFPCSLQDIECTLNVCIDIGIG